VGYLDVINRWTGSDEHYLSDKIVYIIVLGAINIIDGYSC